MAEKMASLLEGKSIINHSLLDRILEQGQKLRNAMVQSILKNDPLTKDVILSSDKHYNTPEVSQVNFNQKTSDDPKLIQAFLNGDYLTKNDEQIALNMIRTMPIQEILNYNQDKENVITSNCSCTCATCRAYNRYNFKCDLRRTNSNNDKNCPVTSHKSHSSNNSSAVDSSNNNNNNNNLLKYVDSLKVILQNVHLNDLGEKKLLLSKPPMANLNAPETFFIEYLIPSSLIERKTSKSKTICNLDNNHIKLCARRTTSNTVIQLKHNSIHDIVNLHECKLLDENIVFFIKYKNRHVKTSQLLGVAKFNFQSLSLSSFSCCKTLKFHLAEGSPIVIGTLKVIIQLGSGKTFFGQEFLDAVKSSDNKLPESDSAEETDFVVLPSNDRDNLLVSKNSVVKVDRAVQSNFRQKTHSETVKINDYDVKSLHASHSKLTASSFDCHKQTEINKIPEQYGDKYNEKSKVELLFGFVYISEAQFINLRANSYIASRLYCQNDLSFSRIIPNSANPLYNFCQIVPLIYEDNLLLKLRENFMIIEFWDKSEQSSTIFGITKLPLNQFYLAYRNHVILHHLIKNQLPIIGIDWWEPIYSITNDVLIGQVQVLTALGTEKQIENLQLERGFKIETVKAKFPTSSQIKSDLKTNYLQNKSEQTVSKNNNNNTLSSTNVNPVQNAAAILNNNKQKVDVAVQSEMDSQDLVEKLLKYHKSLDKLPILKTASVNTEPIDTSDKSVQASPVIRNTSDLLNSLQSALNLDCKQLIKLEKTPSIQVEININSANHLPIKKIVRSKCKRHKIDNYFKQDDVLPSTYVSFETMPGERVQFTNVFPKCRAPAWNFKTKVNLPLELLTNSQKRLIFKVWKISSTAILEPSQQNDIVLGFVAVDIGILLAGLSSVQGWFNIIDFSGKCNGQINIHVTPLEDLDNLRTVKSQSAIIKHQLEASENIECTELLSRTLKRKFIELDEITQRLRQRLSQVVDKDSDDEFESDINTCLNDESDLVSFLEEARKFNQNYCKAQLVPKEDKFVATSRQNVSSNNSLASGEESKKSIEQSSPIYVQETNMPEEKVEFSSSSSSNNELLNNQVEAPSEKDLNGGKYIRFDKHLLDGKQRIEALLDRLNSITVDPKSKSYQNRNVSGCSSDNNTTVAINNEKTTTVHEDICNSNIIEITNLNTEETDTISKNDSETSVATNLSECRPSPVGQGIGDSDS